jgi:hypothetical protein
MILAGVSRFLMAKNGPALINSFSRFVGGSFQSTING